MPVSIRSFSGGLDTDSHYLRVAPSNYIDALNMTREAEGEYTDEVFSNMPGNTLVPFPLDGNTPENVCIGAKEDKVRNRIIYFVYNQFGYHYINSWTKGDAAPIKIFSNKHDTAGFDILNLQLLYKVKDIDVLHRDEDGDILYWNDGINPPRQLNIDDFIAEKYTPVTEDIITQQRLVPRTTIKPYYDTDSTNLVNNFKRKLFQYTYSWGYENDQKSTVAPPSKVVVPLDAYNADIGTDPSKNNVMVLPVNSGPADSKYITIYGRSSLGIVWGDWFIIDTVYLDDYNINPVSTYNYRFLNDAQYITADQDYVNLNFDNSADLCDAQCFVNGNYILQAGVTDGYDAIKREDVNVQITAGYMDTSDNSVSPTNPTITVNQDLSAGHFYIYFEIGPSIGADSVYKIKLTAAVYSGNDLAVDVTYTATGADTPLTVATALKNLIVTQVASAPFTVTVQNGNRVHLLNEQNFPNAYTFENVVYSAIPSIIQSGGTPCHPYSTKERWGLVYKDVHGKTNGVISFVVSEDDPNDFSVTTGDFDFNVTTGNPKLPIINASISHLPPSWANSYEWVVGFEINKFLHYITFEVQTDGQYDYFGIENLNVFKTNNSGFIPSYVFSPGDRLRVLASVSDTSYSLPFSVSDFEILGTVQRPMTKTTGTEDTLGEYIKVRRTSSSPAVYVPHIFISIYTPAVRSDTTTQVFRSIGESYPIYTAPSGVRYHVGQKQNQTISQPATFTFIDGGVYYKFRDFYVLKDDGTINTVSGVYSKGVQDINYSDFFSSAVNSRSTPWVIDLKAKRSKRLEIRFSEAFQPNTSINGLNRFYPGNYEEVIRDHGQIKRMLPWNNGLIVFQQNKIGNMPVFQQILSNVDSSSNVVVSQKLLNRIQYYSGECGIGDVPESLAYSNKSVYGWDNLRGVCWRISQNGLEFISVVHKMNAFAFEESSKRGFNYKIYGAFDTHTNKYITAFEAAPGSAAKTLVWTEGLGQVGFESFVSYLPEMMTCLNGLLITFKNGKLYTHDSPTFNTFYGTTYESSITAVFNDMPTAKKTWEAVTEQASDVWDMPFIRTTLLSYSVPSKTYQSSNLVASDFEAKEDFFHASLKRDSNSQNGIASGDVLKGAAIICKARRQNATTFTFINCVILEYKESPLNNK